MPFRAADVQEEVLSEGEDGEDNGEDDGDGSGDENNEGESDEEDDAWLRVEE